jgi:hypothetical protein
MFYLLVSYSNNTPTKFKVKVIVPPGDKFWWLDGVMPSNTDEDGPPDL